MANIPWDAGQLGAPSPTYNAPGAGMPPVAAGMNPATMMGLISMIGQAGAAIGGPNSWQGRLGSVGANFGSQRLQAMATDMAEKRQMQLLKDLFGKANNAAEVDATKKLIMSPIGGEGVFPTAKDILSSTPDQTGGISSSFLRNLPGGNDFSTVGRK